MVEEKMETLLNFFKVLANENRLKILGILANREAGVDELATLLGLSAPTISHHLRLLRELGLVKMRSAGNDHLYRLDSLALNQITKRMMQSFQSETMAALVEDVPYGRWEKKVLNTFLERDQIKAFPMGYKKRLVVLKWMADHFEIGKSYSEIELNEIIQKHHPDYCTLRREMIDLGMMEREGREYTRLDWKMPDFPDS